MVDEMQAQTSVFSMHVAFITNLPCVVLFLPIFLHKVRYKYRRGWYITGSFDTKK
jgi:hypothetical protein